MLHANIEPNLALEPGEIWWCEGVGREAPHSEAQATRDDTVLAKATSGLMVVVQDDAKSSDLDSVTVCPMTEDEHHSAPYRIPVEAGQGNGLDKRSRLMVDQVATIKKERLKERIGEIDDGTLNRFYYEMLAFMLPDVSIFQWGPLGDLRSGERLPQPKENDTEDTYRAVWTVQDDDDDFARSKPRPAMVVQNMVKFGDTDSVTICLFTTHQPESNPFYRIPVIASQVNGLDKRSQLMVDKVTTIEKMRLKRRIGVLDKDTMDVFYLALIDFMVPEESTFLPTFFQE